MTVHLVGVGPGHADLMTLRAVRLLGRADAVVLDRLIGDDVADFIAPSAERYEVGKQVGGGPGQDEINNLLIDLGRRLDVVVRVKGGDPFVFGRGAEEADALAAAGITVEITPGITSAVAGPASAGISVTRRAAASGFCVVTAHQDERSTPVDWSALARSGLTVVVLMGARRAARIAAALMAGGLAPDTPAAVVTDAARPTQRTWRGRLDELGVTPVASPSVLVIGRVADGDLAAGAVDTPAGGVRLRPPTAPLATG
ncbi:MAG: uroporphyrinogen-III C-methyltransferase [Acidimicrobiales bacterium]